MTDTEALKALVELANKATRGPWEGSKHAYQGASSGEGLTFDEDWNIYPPLGEAGPVAVVPTKEIHDFVVAARNAIPALERLLASPDVHPAPSVATEDAIMAAATAVMERMFKVEDFDLRPDSFKAAYEREKQDVVEILRQYLGERQVDK